MQVFLHQPRVKEPELPGQSPRGFAKSPSQPRGQAESEEEPEAPEASEAPDAPEAPEAEAGSTVSLPMCPPPCGQREVDTLSSAGPWLGGPSGHAPF